MLILTLSESWSGGSCWHISCSSFQSVRRPLLVNKCNILSPCFSVLYFCMGGPIYTWTQWQQSPVNVKRGPFLASKSSSALVSLSATHQSKQQWPSSAPSYWGVSLKAHWQHSTSSHCGRNVMSSVVSKVYISFCFGSIVAEVHSSNFLGGRRPDEVK